MARNWNDLSGIPGVQGERRGDRYGRNREDVLHRDYGATQVNRGRDHRHGAPDDERYETGRYGGQAQYEDDGRTAMRPDDERVLRRDRSRSYAADRYGMPPESTYDYGYPVESRGYVPRRHGGGMRHDPMYEHRPFSDFPYNQKNPDRHLHDRERHETYEGGGGIFGIAPATRCRRGWATRRRPGAAISTIIAGAGRRTTRGRRSVSVKTSAIA